MLLPFWNSEFVNSMWGALCIEMPALNLYPIGLSIC